MKKDWFVHIEWVVVLVTLLGGFYTLDSKIERQGQRCDKLFEIWVKNHETFHKEIQLCREESNKKWEQLLLQIHKTK